MSTTETKTRTDITRSTPRPTGGTFLDEAEELLSRFPNINRAELLGHVTAVYFIAFRYGNKREEHAACDFLNTLQREAVKLQKRQQGGQP